MEMISDPARVVELLLDWNKIHFKQVEGTPFTTKALTQLFGTDGDSTTTEDLINGTIPPINHLPPTVQMILKKIAANPPSTQIDTEVTTERLTTMFKRLKEMTSTLPSGCHLGHWHALLAPDGTIKD